MKARYAMHPKGFKLTAYALGELEGAEQTALEEHLRDCEACRHAVDEARAFDTLVTGEWRNEPYPEPALWPRNVFYPRTSLLDVFRPSRWRWVEVSLVSAAALLLIASLSSFVSFLLEPASSKYGAKSAGQLAYAPKPSTELYRYEAKEGTAVMDIAPMADPFPLAIQSKEPESRSQISETLSGIAADAPIMKPEFRVIREAPSFNEAVSEFRKGSSAPASSAPAEWGTSESTPNSYARGFGGRGQGQRQRSWMDGTSRRNSSDFGFVPGAVGEAAPGT